MTFLNTEKARYIAAKPGCTWLSPDAKVPGQYRARAYDFCIPVAHADENLFAGTRDRLLDYFDEFAIKWHDGGPRRPSNHLCSSMVCGVNFLSVMMDEPWIATRFLRAIFGDEVAEAVPVDGSFVEFEWVGNPEIDYIGEGLGRTRGANATSADAAMAYRRPDGGKTLVLIEWKYTESYSPDFKGDGSRGETRRTRYEHLVTDLGGPIDTSRVTYDELLYEPFYQFLRQQLLAWRMAEERQECGADRVRVLHLSPRANTDFKRVTSPPLAERYPDAKATELWRSLLQDPSRFTPAAVEDAFAPLLNGPGHGELHAAWQAYMGERYPWALERDA